MRRLALAVAIVVLPSCSDDPPADVEGTYAVDVSNGDDDCSFDNFAGGASDLILTQGIDDPAMVSSEFSGGGVAAFLGVALGGSEMTGLIEGRTLTLNRTGADRTTAEFCEYHINAALTGTVNGDAIEGTIVYTGQIDFETADCPFLDNCMSEQSFSGTR